MGGGGGNGASLYAGTEARRRHPWPEGHDDTLLADFAVEIQRRGFKVAGLIQRNGDTGDQCSCVMELIDLGSGDAIRISQELGAGSSSCRVDPGGIAEAGSRLRASLEDRPDLVVVNKFGGLEDRRRSRRRTAVGHGRRAAGTDFGRRTAGGRMA